MRSDEAIKWMHKLRPVAVKPSLFGFSARTIIVAACAVSFVIVLMR